MTTDNEFIETLDRFVDLFGRRTIEDFVRFTKQSGLSMPQITVLIHLYYIGPCEIVNVRRYISGDAVAASQIVDRLVQRGLVERADNPGDRRIRMVHLTSEGKELVQNSIGARKQWIIGIAQKFNEEEQKLIIQSVNLLAGRINGEK
jgi:DNA-binding MarR family transcriptional regulator